MASKEIPKKNKKANKPPVFTMLRNLVEGLDKVLEGKGPIEKYYKIEVQQIRKTIVKVLKTGTKMAKTGAQNKNRIRPFLAKKLAKYITALIEKSHHYRLIFKATKNIDYRDLYLGTAKAISELIKIQESMQ